MDDEHNASFPPPVFASRVLRARLLAEASGKRFVWDERRNLNELAFESDRRE